VSITVKHEAGKVAVTAADRTVGLALRLHPDEAAILLNELAVAIRQARSHTEPGFCRSCRWHRYSHLPCGWLDKELGDLRPAWFRRPNAEECDAVRNCPAWERRAEA
jgi:hypothetical protein